MIYYMNKLDMFLIVWCDIWRLMDRINYHPAAAGEFLFKTWTFLFVSFTFTIYVTKNKFGIVLSLWLFGFKLEMSLHEYVWLLYMTLAARRAGLYIVQLQWNGVHVHVSFHRPVCIYFLVFLDSVSPAVRTWERYYALCFLFFLPANNIMNACLVIVVNIFLFLCIWIWIKAFSFVLYVSCVFVSNEEYKIALIHQKNSNYMP